MAPGAVPLLGHALKYKQNPGAFLVSCIQKVGNLFRINLAGKHMVMVCGPRKQRKVASAPESVLSARQAVADMGFEQMLGHKNVHKGTDIHKPIVKSFLHSTDVVVGSIKSIKKALQLEITEKTTNQVEFMTLIRKVFLRAVIDQLISPDFVAEDWDFPFIEQFMAFQDDLEDATAKSAVLPRFLALTLFLWPIQRRRLKLQITISQRIHTILNNGSTLGFWLNTIHKDGYSEDEISEFIVGLLFAAHKNPAIGAAQSYLFLWERATTDQQNVCKDESKMLLANPTYQQAQTSSPTLHRLCLETLRLTAHSIGAIRTVRHDFQLDEDLIPQGSTIALTHLSSSLNPEYWVDPQRLDLDLKSPHRSKELYENDYIFNVFSHGIHKCPGQRLAIVLLQCTVAILLSDYDITLPKPIPPLCFERATLAQRQGSVNITITKQA